MAGKPLDFVANLKELKEIGDTMVINNDDYEEPIKKNQVSRALYYHGKRNGAKFSYVQIDTGYIIVLVGIDDE